MINHGEANRDERVAAVVSKDDAGLSGRVRYQHEYLVSRWSGVLRNHSPLSARPYVSELMCAAQCELGDHLNSVAQCAYMRVLMRAVAVSCQLAEYASP